jgi:hypothetical protein
MALGGGLSSMTTLDLPVGATNAPYPETTYTKVSMGIELIPCCPVLAVVDEGRRRLYQWRSAVPSTLVR